MLDMWADISDAQTAQYCHDELGNSLLLAHITTGEYVPHFVISESTITM